MKKAAEGFRRLKLLYQLVGINLLTGSVPLLAVSLILLGGFAAGMEETLSHEALMYNTQVVYRIDTFLNTYSNLTKLLVTDYEVITELNASDSESMYRQVEKELTVRKLLMRLNIAGSDIRNMMLMTSSGNCYQYSDRGIAIRKEVLLEADWVKTILTSRDNMMISRLHSTDYYEGDTGGLAVSAARKIYGANGQLAATLIVDLDPFTLVQLPDAFKLWGKKLDITVRVENKAGEPVYHSALADGSLPAARLLEGTYEDAGTPEASANDPGTLVQSTKDDLLRVTVTIPQSQLMHRLNRLLTWAGLFILLNGLLSILISTRLARSVTRPIQTLQRHMQKAEQGQYLPMEGTSSSPEVSDLISHYNSMVDRIQNLIGQVYLSSIKQRDAQLMALRTQINPHMLYNTLEAIRMKAVVNRDAETAQMIKILAQMFRMALRKEGHSTVETELVYAENYISLQNIRFPDRYHLQTSVDEACRKAPMIPIVFQPILENSIVHGRSSSHDTLHMTITARREAEELVILFENNGEPMTEERRMSLNALFDRIREGEIDTVSEQEDGSIGLKNIAERLYLEYGAGSGLRILHSDDTGTVLSVNVPFGADDTPSMGGEADGAKGL